MELYRQEDAQQILQLAIARQVESGELTRAQLLEIADEMGIAPSDLAMAEQEWLKWRGEAQERKAFEQARRLKFQHSASKYLIFNGFLVIIDLIGGGGLSWSLYVVLGWGLLLALEAWKTFLRRGDEYEDAFQSWRRKRHIK